MLARVQKVSGIVFTIPPTVLPSAFSRLQKGANFPLVLVKMGRRQALFSGC
jgi:hypothetical protein